LLDALVRHRPYLNRYAYSRLRHRGAAEDVVQEALLAAVEGLSRFKGESSPLTWLTGILKHKIVDWQRREERNPSRVTAPAWMETGEDCAETPGGLFDPDGRWLNPPSSGMNPEQAFESRKFWEMLEGCLAELPATTAQAFYLREIQGLETQEICGKLGISESNCWVMLHRARMSLRQKIEERWLGRTFVSGADASRTQKATRSTSAAATGPLAPSMG
jgi:RNA polymerase sigma-70 factor (ECF subfamily)